MRVADSQLHWRLRLHRVEEAGARVPVCGAPRPVRKNSHRNGEGPPLSFLLFDIWTTSGPTLAVNEATLRKRAGGSRFRMHTIIGKSLTGDLTHDNGGAQILLPAPTSHRQ